MIRCEPNSQDGSSEEFIGEWAETRGIRDQLVIATKVCIVVDNLFTTDRFPIKYTMNFHRGDPSLKQKAVFTGNSIKSLHLSVEASLKKLRTSYIDILYVHWYVDTDIMM
jgi:aryl-alcohol dehydrogenase-like predicted oxidoreductase